MNDTHQIRVALLSSTTFGLKCLKDGILPLSMIKLVGIITTPPQIEFGRKRDKLSIVSTASFETEAQIAGCDLLTFSGRITVNDYRTAFEKWRPDLVLALGWYHIVPQKVLTIPPLGCAAIHASLLPKYRGMAPINWAIINGETETGVTFFYLDKGVDDGDVIAQVPIPVDNNDTCATLYDKATKSAITLLRDNLPRIANGTACRIKQNDDEATCFPRRTPEDGLIDWNWNAKRVYDFIRAQTKPYPGAFTFLNDRKLHIWQARVAGINNDVTIKPGNFLIKDNSVDVQCADRLVRLLDVQWADDDTSGDPLSLLADTLLSHSK